MRRQARLPEFFDQIGKKTLFWDLVQNTPPPFRKWKFGQILALWVLTTTEHPPSPRKLKCGQVLAFWVLTTTEHPSSPQKLNFRQILTLWVLTTTEHPPPPQRNLKFKFRQILALWGLTTTNRVAVGVCGDYSLFLPGIPSRFRCSIFRSPMLLEDWIAAGKALAISHRVQCNCYRCSIV